MEQRMCRGFLILVCALVLFAAGCGKKQEETTTPYAAMLTKEMGLADWSKDAETLERLIRGLDPWPGVYSYLDGKMLKLWKAEVLPEDEGCAAPGTILSVKNGLAVQTGKGALLITELQPEGKKRMAADAWLRGARVSPGDCFRNER